MELLGLWENIHNPDFKPIEFEGFRKQAGLLQQGGLKYWDNLNKIDYINFWSLP